MSATTIRDDDNTETQSGPFAPTPREGSPRAGGGKKRRGSKLPATLFFGKRPFENFTDAQLRRVILGDCALTPEGEAQRFEQVMVAAREVIERTLLVGAAGKPYLGSPKVMREFLRVRMAKQDYESFWCLWLDAQNRLIAAEELFRGTLTQTSVYPREIVKAALRNSAASVVLAHPHPSGSTEPSRADELLTRTIRDALAMVDVKVLDHFIVADGSEGVSFAERGLL